MSLALYIKQNPQEAFANKIRKKKRDRFFAAAISVLGLSSILFASWPFFIWNFELIPQLSAKIESAPIPKGEVLSTKTTLLKDVQVARDADGFSFFTTNFRPSGNRPEKFYLTIPKMEIKDAIVKVDTVEFYDSLGLFPGSALPGEEGNSFITGHSVLPQFSDPTNYREIFTNLPKLEIGDTVFAQVEGKTYQYVVQYKKVVDPSDTSVLAPIARGAKTLTLMTCVPPGTSFKRLIVVTSLI